VLFVSTFQHQIATMLAESTRKKSCASCRLAKTRCNMAAPKCSRCEMRRIECAYEMKRYASSVSNSNEYNQAAESTSHGTTVSNHRGPSMASSSSLAAEVLVEHLDAFQHDMASQDPRRVALDALPGQGLENGLQNELDLDWDFGLHSWDAGRSGIEDDQSATAFENLNTIIDRPTDMKDLGITNFPSRQSRIQFSYPMLLDKDSQSQPRSPSPPSMPGHSLPSGGRALVQSSPRILAILPDPNIPGLFLPRNFATSSTSFTAKYLMAVLSSFPKLMTNNSVLPRYIHPYQPKNKGNDFVCYNDKTCLPEPLAVCSSIVQMFLTKTGESNAFIWRTIRSEQQRLYKEVCILRLRDPKKNA